MTNFEKYTQKGFNPLTVNEIKENLSKGRYNRILRNNKGEELIFEDQALESLIAQIDRICGIE